jgi:predicted permease
MFSDAFHRLRALFRRSTVEREMAEELQFHVDRQVEAYRQLGLDDAQARRRTRLAFGGLDQISEDVRDARGTRWLEDLLRDVGYAFRTYRRLPGFAAIALLLLALGIGATTIMFTVINSVLLRPLAYPEPDRLVTLHGFTEGFGEWWGASYPDFIDIQRESRSLTMAAWRDGGGTISAPGDPEYVDGRQISAELFAVLGLHVSQGRPFLPGDDRPGASPVAIVSQSLWQRRFGGSAAAVGQRLVFEGISYTIVGVAPMGFGSEGGLDVFTPLGENTEPRMQNREARFLRVVARLAPGAELSEAQAELALIARRLATQFPASNGGRRLLVRPLQQDIVGDIGSTFWLLLAAVGLVLLIACVNVASLLLARAASRERELATRVSLGASRARVVRQCLTESGVLGLIGGVFGIVLAAAAVRPFVVFWPGGLPRAAEIQLDWRVLLAALTLSLASGLAFGLAPAMRVPMGRVEGALRGASGTIVRSSRRLHNAFVVTELALAAVLLVSAGMLARTLVALASLDPGLNVHNVLTARVALSPGVLGNPAQISAAWRDVLDRARRVPGVESAALTDIVPMREGENSVPYSITAAMPPPGQAPIALASSVTPDYLKVMGIPLRAGRFFDEHDRLDSEPVVVIDDTLSLHAFGGGDVVDRQLWVPAMGAPVRIVGVVGHVRHWGLAGDDRSRVRDQMYYPFAQVPPALLRTFASFMSIAVRTSIAPLDTVEPLRRDLRGASGDQALYEVRTMEQLVSGSLARQRFLALLFAIFGGVALFLACVGLYGVLAYLTSQRVREFGVRMALGAAPRDVTRLVLRQSLAMIAVGAAIGAAGTWVAGRVLLRLVDSMHALEVSTVTTTTAILVVAALIASYVPAMRASHTDAMTALRQE